MLAYSRIWKLDQERESVKSLRDTIYQTNGNPNQLPIEVNGRVLAKMEMVDDFQVAEEDILMYEVKIRPNDRFPFTKMARSADHPNSRGFKSLREGMESLNNEQDQTKVQLSKLMKRDLGEVMRGRHKIQLPGL